LPKLEQYYLRHTNEPELMRRLLIQAVSGQLGKDMIECDSG
jgi:hypothetical protein